MLNEFIYILNEIPSCSVSHIHHEINKSDDYELYVTFDHLDKSSQKALEADVFGDEVNIDE